MSMCETLERRFLFDAGDLEADFGIAGVATINFSASARPGETRGT